MYDIFFVLLLEQDTIKKRQVNNQVNQAISNLEKKFKIRANKDYKIKAIHNNALYSQKIKNYLLGFY